MKYAVSYNPKIETSKDFMEQLTSLLKKNNVEFEVQDISNLHAGPDFVFVIGGDGTILKCARFFAKYQTPIFGINLGRLGFLSQASGENIEQALNLILANQYKVENRMMLRANEFTALNDFVIKGEEQSRISNFKLYIDDKFVCEYLADGVIIATPTGSTAYGMAAGGPILVPNIENIEIVPICPHTFTARPIIVPSDSKIKIVANRDSEYCVSADGQEVFTFKNTLIIEKSLLYANLALLNSNDFYEVLRNKLNWGISPVKL